MSDQYYTLEKAAEILEMTPGDLNRLRESGKIRAFRDGGTWKFRKEDIDNHLTAIIKDRSQLDDDSDLLNDSEDEERPTMMADSDMFESLAINGDDLKISAREEDNETLISAGDALDDRLSQSSSSSGISLLDDEGASGNSGSESGISLLDDAFFNKPSESKIDLGDEDIILGKSSDSGLSLASDSGIALGQISSSGSGIASLSEEDAALFSSDLDDSTTSNPMNAASVPMKEDTALGLDDDVFELQAAPEESSQESEPIELGLSEDTDSPYDLADSTSTTTPPIETDATATATLEIATDDEDENDAFKLATFPEEEESVSDSSSQDLALDESASQFLSDDALLNSPANMDPLSESSTGAIPNDPFSGMGDLDAGDPLGTGNIDPMGGMDDPMGGMSDPMGSAFGDPMTGDFGDSSAAASGMESFDTPISASGGAGGTSSAPVEPEKKTCPYTRGEGCVSDPGYTGLGVGLGLIPCLLVLILAGIGVYELIRVIWSWDQPYALTGSVLETIGGLLKLF